jgi:hypothetical protein
MSVGVTANQSIIQELKEQHGLVFVEVPCPCIYNDSGMKFLPDPDCDCCEGEGRIQYGIEELVFA